MEKTKLGILPAVEINSDHNLALMLLGRLISSTGTVAFNFALSLYVLDLTRSAIAYTMVISFSMVPGILVNILVGVFVDRNDKKKIIIISDMLSGLSVFIFMLLFKLHDSSIILFIVYVVVLNTFQSFFNLSINAVIPNLISENRVAKANSAFQALGAVINIAGPVLGALLYKLIGMEMIFLLNAASFILAGILEMLLTYRRRTDGYEEQQDGRYVDKIKEVFKYIDKNKILKFLLTMAVVFNMILNPLILLVLQYITYNVINVTGLQVSMIKSSWAAGTIIGALYVMTRKTHIPLLKKFFVLLEVQAVLIILWIFPEFSILGKPSGIIITVTYVVLIFLYGMLNTIQNLPLISHFQLIIPEELRGRVFGVLCTALNISTPLGMWVFGLCLQKMDWTIIPLVSGVLVFIICCLQSRNKYFKEFINNLEERKD